MTILANTIWGGSIAYGFQFMGLQVFVDLGIEVLIVWGFLRRFESLKRLCFLVVITNLASFFVGVPLLTAIEVPKHSLTGLTAVWCGAFLISWLVEGWLFRIWVQAAPRSLVIRAVFWSNVASYTITALLLIAYMRGASLKWLLIR